ncbi:hypothetical protein EYB58_20470 [Desulfobacter hydrogenophilus]|uniref:Uncharacterized protein n=1 Tax=Desulfobacter hydrogenophilus TaxID=2291 RepID=A0ABX5RLB1_9BACT|nr:hypothetical protein EYB58_20470 [Desulfobacter hydrogenophilus]
MSATGSWTCSFCPSHKRVWVRCFMVRPARSMRSMILFFCRVWCAICFGSVSVVSSATSFNLLSSSTLFLITLMGVRSSWLAWRKNLCSLSRLSWTDDKLS